MKYDFEMELDERTSVGKIVAHIKDGSNILEFGPGNGRMTRYLMDEKKCEVSIVELDKELYEFVKEFSKDAFYGNIEDYDWTNYFDGQEFDYVIFADVLEHLMNPQKALEMVKPFLKETGEILITFPNIAHNSVLIDLFNNKMNWNDYGLLDKTHKSFYTQSGFVKLFSELDLFISKEDFTINQVGYNEIDSHYEDLPVATRAGFKARPFGEVYQYFYALAKKEVEHPIRTIPENSSYLKEFIVLYECTDREEEFSLSINNNTGVNKQFELNVPEDIVRLKIFPSKQGVIVDLAMTVENQLVEYDVTNAVYVREGQYFFFNDNEVPIVEITGQNIAGKTVNVNINYLYEGEFSENIHNLIDYTIQQRDSLKLAQIELEEVKERLKVVENELSDHKDIVTAVKRNYKELSNETKWNKQTRKKEFIFRESTEEELESIVSLNIDDVARDNEKGTTIIRGWGYDKQHHEPLKLSLEANEAMYYRVSSEYRRDVIDMFELPGQYDFGFTIEVYDEVVRPNYHLTITTADDKKAGVLATVFGVEPNESMIERSFNSIRSRGLIGSAKWYFRRKKEISEPVEDVDQILKEIAAFSFNPLISVAVPVYNVEEKWLEACVSSLQNQYYENWELCLADDASPKSYIRPLLEEYMAKDPRIKVVFREKNGHISEATNSALEIASGDYVGFMDNDDELAPKALYEIVKALNEDQTIDFFYTDEDKITENGKRFNAFYKSNWNPELLLNHNYITHFVVVRKDLLNEIGGLNTEFNGSQDYDFVLRATEKANNIVHIPGIMYHWRAIESSTALNPESKNYAYVAGQRAVKAAVDRRGLDAIVDIGEFYGSYKINYIYKNIPKVSIVVFNENKKLNDSIKRLLQKTEYSDFEIILAAKNRSHLNIHDDKIHYIDSDSINELVSNANGEFIVLFNQDLEPISTSWLKELMNFAQKDNVGLATAKILDERYRVVNVGVSLEENRKKIVYPEQGTPGKSIGYYYRIALPRNIQAATEDCMIFRKADFEKVSGLTEGFDSGVMGIDFSLKIKNKLAKEVVYCSYSNMKIHEIPKKLDASKVFGELRTNWSSAELEDPYRNPMHN